MAVGGYSMVNNSDIHSSDFEKTIKEFLKEGREKLANDLAGTREAIKLIANDKTRDFLKTMDKGLDKEEREFLSGLIVTSMYQSFCYGYGIGKIEGHTNNRVIL
jgi:hypothetical protein